MDSSKPKAYIYPITSRPGGQKNPYVYHFIGSLEEYIDFLNSEKPSNKGIIDLIKYLWQIDLLFLNWPEDIPEKKGGLMQTLIFMVCIQFLKIKKVRIVYTLHNKEPHNKIKLKLKGTLRKFIINKADLVLTHAKEGFEIIKQISKNKSQKIVFFNHPVLPRIDSDPDIEKKYDIIIWGAIEPYKGIHKFISLIKEQKFNDVRILIAGKINSESYKKELLYAKPDNIEIIDKFISNEELQYYISVSRAVLFTYIGSSILSSGALIDSLRYVPIIIGPDFGSFHELAQENLIYTYSDDFELAEIIRNIGQLKLNKEEIILFVENNSWKAFGKSFYTLCV